ncbi:hypothetical protein K8I61_12785 [bacterium]|nr:hypothetical protein [bacterium]
MQRTVSFAAFLVVVLAFSAFAADDIHIEESLETTTTDAQPTLSGTIETWISGDKMRVESFGRDVVIYRADKKLIYRFHEPSKTYVELPMHVARKQAETEMQGFVGLDDRPASAIFRATGRDLKLGKFDCKELELQVTQVVGPGITKQERRCVSEKAAGGVATLERVFRISMGGELPPSAQKILDGLRAAGGYPVQQVSVTDDGARRITSTKTLRGYHEQKLDPVLFEVPNGYRKVELPPGVVTR